MQGPFTMNDRWLIEDAAAPYHAGQMGQLAAFGQLSRRFRCTRGPLAPAGVTTADDLWRKEVAYSDASA